MEHRPEIASPTGFAPESFPAQEQVKHPSRTNQMYKSPFVAGMLSLIPGLGQIYLGYYKHGFLFMFTFASVITIISSGLNSLEPLLGIFLSFFFFFTIIDAVRRAKLYNQVIDGVRVAELPGDFDTPELKGSVGVGLLLVCGGGILFLHTMFGMPLDWIQDWWPVFVIGFGLYLIYKDLKDRDALPAIFKQLKEDGDSPQ